MLDRNKVAPKLAVETAPVVQQRLRASHGGSSTAVEDDVITATAPRIATTDGSPELKDDGSANDSTERAPSNTAG